MKNRLKFLVGLVFISMFSSCTQKSAVEKRHILCSHLIVFKLEVLKLYPSKHQRNLYRLDETYWKQPKNKSIITKWWSWSNARIF